MFVAVSGSHQSEHQAVFRTMFEERKRVFVDLLKWDIPVLAGRYEVDQFDDEDAFYLIVLDEAGRHTASARLLRTDRPHILDTLYPSLCVNPLPRGKSIREITRFCLSRHLHRRARRAARNQLITGLAEYALLTGITSYTGVAEIAWLQQILSFGWHCWPLGLPQRHGSSTLSALRIEITDETIPLLRDGGVYAPVEISAAATLELA